MIKCLVFGIPISFVGITLWWGIKKYKEANAKTVTVPASKEHMGMEQDSTAKDAIRISESNGDDADGKNVVQKKILKLRQKAERHQKFISRMSENRENLSNNALKRLRKAEKQREELLAEEMKLLKTN